MKEYFTIADFNYVEDYLDTLTTELKLINNSLPSFTKKTWFWYDFPYIQEVFRIEEAINNINIYITNISPYNYKKWLDSSTSIDYKNFKWADYQNWLNGINTTIDYKDKLEIRYSGEGYSGDIIWL